MSTTPQELVERVLQGSDTDDCIVLVHSSSDTNLRWARNTLTTNGETSESSMTVIAVVGRDENAAIGSVSRSGLDLSAVPELLALARAAALDAGPSSDARPLVRGLAASPDWSDAAQNTSGAVFGELAPALGEVFSAASSREVEHFGYAAHSVVTTYLATSTGLRLRHAQPEGRLELNAKSHARTRSAWLGAPTRDFVGVDLPAMAAQLDQRLQWQGRHIAVAPGRHDAILTPSSVSDLLIDMYWSAVGRDAAEGRSVFSGAGGGTRIGESVAGPGVDLSSDPMMSQLQCAPFVATAASSGSASVFDNGLPLTATKWIDAGVLSGLITTRASAAEFDLPVRPGIDNLSLAVAGGGGDESDLTARCPDGLLVTCLWYNRVVDPQTLLLTGLTRDGVYVVSGGEVVGATTNFRFNDSPVGLLTRIVDAGATVPTLAREMGDYFNRAAMPPLRVADFNFSTISQAS